MSVDLHRYEHNSGACETLLPGGLPPTQATRYYSTFQQEMIVNIIVGPKLNISKHMTLYYMIGLMILCYY